MGLGGFGEQGTWFGLRLRGALVYKRGNRRKAVTPSRVSPSPPGEFPATKGSHRPMQKMTEGPAASRPQWEMLEAFARTHVRDFIQQLLEDEVTELLVREKSARRVPVDAPRGARNGYGQPRRFALMNGTITVRRPRVRDLEARFVNRLLPLFQRRTPEVAALLPELLGPRRLRTRPARAAGRRGAALGELARASEGYVARAVHCADLPLGRRRVREGRPRHRQGGPACGYSYHLPPSVSLFGHGMIAASVPAEVDRTSGACLLAREPTAEWRLSHAREYTI